MSSNNEKPNRLSVWGHGILNKLPDISRKRRKREASKKRRILQLQEVQQRAEELSR